MPVKTNEFDPLAYIENAFLDKEGKDRTLSVEDLSGDLSIQSIGSYLGAAAEPQEAEKPKKFRKTEMKAPRPRRARSTPAETAIDPDLQQVWETLPKSLEFLCGFFDDGVTANYYRGEFKESRQELIRRLLDPELTLEETSRLLGVCPATVRRYTNRGWLEHVRTQGGQRRFRLSHVVRFVEEHGRFPEE